jgi:hypothetical protein
LQHQNSWESVTGMERSSFFKLSFVVPINNYSFFYKETFSVRNLFA